MTVHHIMRRIMMDSFTQVFCLGERKGKRLFLGLRLLEVIIAAVQSNHCLSGNMGRRLVALRTITVQKKVTEENVKQA